MIKADLEQIKKLEHDLGQFAHKALPHATRNTLNKAAFQARGLSQERIEKNFVNRNQHAQRSVRVDQARGTNLRRMVATVGSTADYMEKQEFGGMKKKTGKHGVTIPTSHSAGLDDDAKPRTKLVRKPNRLARIALKKGNSFNQFTNTRQRVLVAARVAANTGDRYVFLDMGRKKGIFKVLGGRRGKVNRGWPSGAKIKMVHDLSETVVKNKPSPWLKPAVDDVQAVVPSIHIRSLEFQLKRHGLFRG